MLYAEQRPQTSGRCFRLAGRFVMVLRGFVVLAVLAALSAPLAHASRPRIVGTVHDGTVCWDPDVEFPVPCDEDGN
jgi:hypothetical protein